MLGEYSIASLIIMVAVISFLGFMLENTWLVLTKGFFDNRNMTFPFLLGYGLLVVGMYMIVGTPEKLCILGAHVSYRTAGQKYLIYFVLSFLIVTIGEIILGHFVEKVFGFEYWNYTRLPLHITKYTSIPTSIGFALIITAFMGKCFAPIMTVINNISEHTMNAAAVVLAVVMTSDFIFSFAKMYKNHSLNVIWKKQVSEIGVIAMLSEKKDHIKFNR